jgi:hypothetical protein
MSRRHLGILPCVLLIVCNLSAFARAPPKAYGPPIGVENAKNIAAVALAESKKKNWYMAVAVVDPSGTLVKYEKMDNTQTGAAPPLPSPRLAAPPCSSVQPKYSMTRLQAGAPVCACWPCRVRFQWKAVSPHHR